MSHLPVLAAAWAHVLKDQSPGVRLLVDTRTVVPDDFDALASRAYGVLRHRLRSTPIITWCLDEDFEYVPFHEQPDDDFNKATPRLISTE